ncbi:MAG: ATP-binding protein [Myxococcota bacterium]
MFDRLLASRVRQRLREFPAVAILGPRQVGKTTLARTLWAGQDASRVDYLDLENPVDLAKLDDASSYLRSRFDRIVILDEVQRVPGLFGLLRGVIDERLLAGAPAGHFLLLGSASLDLLKQSSESLAGRIAFLELEPFDIRELPEEYRDKLWVRGGFPRSVLAPSDDASAAWRENFIRTYLERDIPQLGPRLPAELLRRFWTMLAHRQGGLFNASELARSLGITSKTVARYLDLLVDLLLVRRLEPLYANVEKRLVKSPKVYVKDSGLVHALLRVESLDDLLGHPVAGASFEGFVIDTILRACPPRTQWHFYRTAAGAEIDLILDLPGGDRWAIEVKRSSAPALGKGFRTAFTDVDAERGYIVYNGTERIPKARNVEAIGLLDICSELKRD